MARTIGEIADDVLERQEKVKAMNAQIKDIEKEIDALKLELAAAADKEGMTAGAGAKSKFKIEPTTLPQGGNWDKFYEYMAENKYFHLLHKRFSVTGCQELWDQGIDIPGVDKFQKNEVKVGAA